MYVGGYLYPDTPSRKEDSGLVPSDTEYSSCGGEYSATEDLRRDALIASGHLKDLRIIADYEAGKTDDEALYMQALENIGEVNKYVPKSELVKDEDLIDRRFSLLRQLNKKYSERRYSSYDYLKEICK